MVCLLDELCDALIHRNFHRSILIENTHGGGFARDGVDALHDVMEPQLRHTVLSEFSPQDESQILQAKIKND